MPEQPPPKRRTLLRDPQAGGTPTRARAWHPSSAVRYAELHCKTNFSFLEGASHADELVGRAAELGYAALAATDRNSLAGVVRAHIAAKEAGLKLLVGAEVTPIDAPPVVLLATDRAAYGRLSRLLTLGRRRAPKGECRLTFENVAEYAEGLLAAVVLRQGDKETRGQGDGDVAPHRTLAASVSERVGRLAPHPTLLDKPAVAPFSTHHLSLITHHLPCYRAAFGDRCYALAELHRGPDDERALEGMIELARQARVPLVAANDVHYHEPARHTLHDALVAIREGCTVAEAGGRLFPNAERYLKSPAQMAELFGHLPEAVRRTVEVASRCHFSLDELRYEYPEELCPPGTTPIEHLVRLTWAGAQKRYPDGIPEKVRRLLEHELRLIEDLHYEAYFLTVWDLVRFARARDILCQGRGSAANSAVCYCLEVTSVDPERIDVLFERFVSRERNEAPDIDVDFEHERREEVLQYLYDKYGRERAGMTAEVITYRPRSAVRDVGKALGLSLDRIDTLAKTLEHYREDARLPGRLREAGLDPASDTAQRLVMLVRELVGFPRHLSQHVGGMVITQGPLCELVPIENAAMAERTVIQWDKDDLDALGILKVDCLALGMLTAIHKCFDLVERHYGEEPRSQGVEEFGRRQGGSTPARQEPRPPKRPPIPEKLTLANVPAEDPAVYEMVSRADTIGVFQIESRAQMSMLPRLRPQRFYDLVIEVAIVRPGPIQGNMVHPYLRRRAGGEPVEYPNEEVRAVLEKTLGVPIFQEQAMRLAMVAAGFTPGEADQLRRAMGAWRRPGVIDQFRQKLIDGMRSSGYSAEFAEQVFRQIRGFGEYGFPESHAASFALLVYVSAWLKRYYPAAFTAALLNSQPMGFYAPAQLVRDAREHGVEVRPVDVNASDWDCTLEAGGQGPGIRGQTSEENHRAASASGRVRCSQAGSSSGTAGQASSGTLPAPCLRLGLRMVRGLSQSHAEAIERAREQGPFTSLEDFARRTGLTRATLTRLAKADAFGSLGLDRRVALWEALPQGEELPLFQVAGSVMRQERAAGSVKSLAASGSERIGQLTPPPALLDKPAVAPSHSTHHSSPITHHHSPIAFPPLAAHEEVVADYQTVGLSLRAHPMSFLRPALDRRRILRASQLSTWPNGRYVRVAGLVLMRQRPSTASGITFVTLEDETGVANLIVRPEIWQRYHRAARRAQGLLAHGTLERKDEVVHVLVSKLEDLSRLPPDLNSRSRDFR